MDPLSQALSSLMSFLGLGGSSGQLQNLASAGFPGAAAMTGGSNQGLASILPTILQLLTAGTGAYYGMDQLQQMQRLYDQQRAAEGIAMNPAALAQRAVTAAVPLDRQLAYMVNAAADANTARRGLAQSPGAVASGEASALAPYAQENLQLGAQMGEFGFPLLQGQTTPNYLQVLDQLNNLGRSTYSLPAGVLGGANMGLPGTTP